MNTILKQNLSKVSKNCKDESDYFLITSEYVIYNDSVYIRPEESSWTISELSKESVLDDILGLKKDYEKIKVENKELKAENNRLSVDYDALLIENDELCDENEKLKKSIENINNKSNEDIDKLSERIRRITIERDRERLEVKKPIGKSVSQDEMAKAINDLRINLISSQNVAADEELCKQIVWIEDKDDRLKSLSEIILFTSEKGAGKNNSTLIYKNYRFLDFWNQLYEDQENESFNFKNDFIEATKIIKDNTKAYRRYIRWSKIFNQLPQGSYLSCTLPNSYWKLIHDEKFKQVLENF